MREAVWIKLSRRTPLDRAEEEEKGREDDEAASMHGGRGEEQRREEGQRDCRAKEAELSSAESWEQKRAGRGCWLGVVVVQQRLVDVRMWRQ